jgi:hypothetical protein
VKLATLSPFGAVDVVLVPGDTDKLAPDGALTITAPLPPFPFAVPLSKPCPPPPPPNPFVPGVPG